MTTTMRTEAAETALEFERRLNAYLYLSEFDDAKGKATHDLVQFLWDEKVGLLRALQFFAASAEPETP